MIYDDCGYLRTELLNTMRCAACNGLFREDESDWASLCQGCGEAEEEEEGRS